MYLPFYQRHHAGSENEYMKNCLTGQLETDGFFMERLLEKTKGFYPGHHLLFTPSCTLALDAAINCLDLQPGDEIILPSFNFPSAANAVLLHGGIPVLCDISGDTQNLSLADAASKITKKTRAVIAVHYAGISCPMKELGALTQEAGIALIEDAAQGTMAYYLDQPLGAIGDFGAVSFHHTKNITCGEGGLMITKDSDAYELARQYRLHGTNRAMFLNGTVDRYTWNIPGTCSPLSEPCAAILYAQMEEVEQITRRRVFVMNRYLELLKPLEEKGTARLMVIPDYAVANGHIFYLRLENHQQCISLQEYLLSCHIDCKTHYVPLHASPMGKQLGYREWDCPESLRCYETLLRLPVHTGLSDSDVEYIAGKILFYYNIR